MLVHRLDMVRELLFVTKNVALKWGDNQVAHLVKRENLRKSQNEEMLASADKIGLRAYFIY